MNGYGRIAAVSLGAVFLAGCGTQLEKAERLTPQGTAFDQALYEGYVKLSQGEYGEGDYRDSDSFALRAISAAGEQAVEPEKIEARGLPADKVGELAGARARLVAALAEGAAARKPAEAAQTQVAFDCWMQEQEENFQPADIAACRDDVLAGLETLEQRELAAAPLVAEPGPEPLPGPYKVHFTFDGSGLSPDAKVMLADVIKAAKGTDAKVITVKGYTDLVGPDPYNLDLSERRTQAVVDFLLQSGLQKEGIVGAGYGKEDPLVPSPRPEEMNRRVEIEFAR